MTNQQITDKVIAAIMLRDFARKSQTTKHMHAALADEAEAIANRLLEI